MSVRGRAVYGLVAALAIYVLGVWTGIARTDAQYAAGNRYVPTPEPEMPPVDIGDQMRESVQWARANVDVLTDELDRMETLAKQVDAWGGRCMAVGGPMEVAR